MAPCGCGGALAMALALASSLPVAEAFSPATYIVMHRRALPLRWPLRVRASAVATPAIGPDPVLDNHWPIDREFPSLRQIHRSPDIFVVDDYLKAEECDDMIRAASEKGMGQSPVVYGGYTEDAKVFARLLPIPALLVVNALLNMGLPTWEVCIPLTACINSTPPHNTAAAPTPTPLRHY